jgi:glycosyltransferase involved in cell wall biosynthesis
MLSPVSGPQVSVIVPVRNRRDLLAKLLDSLAAQTVEDHEIVVVDDGSTDGSGDEARDRAAAGAPITVLDGGGRGAVEARCLGVSVARGPVLAFTDSDCQPAADWLERGLAHIAAGADVVQGLTEPTGVVRPLERTVWVTADDGLYATCNVLYRRSAYDAAGGFDRAAGERIGFRPGRTLRGLGMGEDTLLGWRVRRAGHSVFAADVIVRHHVFPPDVREHLSRSWNAGGFASLVREVPELRDVFLRHRFLLGSTGRLPLYGAGILVLARRHKVAAAFGAMWIANHALQSRRSPGSLKRRAASLPVVLLGDAISAASLIAGSIRARRLVL